MYHFRLRRLIFITLLSAPVAVSLAEHNPVAHVEQSKANSQRGSEAPSLDQAVPVRFSSAVTHSVNGSIAQGLAVGDLNGDGYPDVVISDWTCVGCSTGQISVLLGNGDGTFQSAVNISFGHRIFRCCGCRSKRRRQTGCSRRKPMPGNPRPKLQHPRWSEHLAGQR
jgi:hypothetical protein